jgi:hypothetical protein
MLTWASLWASYIPLGIQDNEAILALRQGIPLAQGSLHYDIRLPRRRLLQRHAVYAGGVWDPMWQIGAISQTSLQPPPKVPCYAPRLHCQMSVLDPPLPWA